MPLFVVLVCCITGIVTENMIQTIDMLDEYNKIFWVTIRMHSWQQWIYTYIKKNNSVTFPKYIPLYQIRYKLIHIFLLILEMPKFRFFAPCSLL